MNDLIVELNGLGKNFGAGAVLKGLDWQIRRGQVVGLLGRNGAGKSTLLECLLGLQQAGDGSARLFGEDPRELSDAVRAKIGYVPQKAELFGWLTPRQMLAYFKTLYPRWDDERVTQLLERWGFLPTMLNRPIEQLSLGEQQRLSIVRALAHRPEFLVLDEPVASLDPFGRRAFLRELVGEVIEHGTTVVFSTHILSDLERVALDVAFLKDGRIALQGSLDGLLEGARRIFGTPAELDKLRLAHVLQRTNEGDSGTSVVALSDAAELERIRIGHPALRVEALGLEDLFVEVTR